MSRGVSASRVLCSILYSLTAKETEAEKAGPEGQRDKVRLRHFLHVYPRPALTVFPPGSGSWHILVLLQLVQQARAPLILPALAQRPLLCKAAAISFYLPSPAVLASLWEEGACSSGGIWFPGIMLPGWGASARAAALASSRPHSFLPCGGATGIRNP